MSDSFLNQVLSETYDRAHDPDAGDMRLTALTDVLLSHLEEAGIISEGVPAYFQRKIGRRSTEVHAYCYDSEENLVQLFVCLDSTSAIPLGERAGVVTVSKPDVDQAFRRMRSFVECVYSGKLGSIELSSPVYELANLLKDTTQDDVAFSVLTTGRVSDRTIKARANGERREQIWDLTRFERVCSNESEGEIIVDFEADFGAAIPCLITPPSDDGLRVLMAAVPGQILADIYNEHRAALLERNVRSFLQFKGKVNKGIRDTLINEPHRFLTYNNGLAATAARVELAEDSGGTGKIRSVIDFQIVNGGQTTATLAACSRRDKADLSAVVVPIKLTVVPNSKLGRLVPKISRFANTQNRIQDSDFRANDPWHIRLEQLSRRVWTNGSESSPQQTQWFFERSRGQYADRIAQEATPAGRKKFRTEHPTNQKFVKTDAAKFVLSWYQYPSIVSRGAQKCFAFFVEKLRTASNPNLSEKDFRKVIAWAILFKRIEKLYGEMGYQGYRANVVTYSMARLSHECGRRLDVDAFWKLQTVPHDLLTALKVIVPGVREVITSPPDGQRNVSEWAKKDACWQAVLNRPIQTDLDLSTASTQIVELADTDGAGNATSRDSMKFEAANAELCQQLAQWGERTGRLSARQRATARELCALLERDAQLTDALVSQAEQLVQFSVGQGFRSSLL